jgi:hypothetical protein
MGSKIYVAYKPCGKPTLHVKFHKDGPWNDMSESGIGYFEDEIGYYSIVGELICDAE